MMRTVAHGDPTLAKWLDRRVAFDPSVVSSVARTIQEVSVRGAEAVLEHARRFDAPGVERVVETVSEVELPEAHQDAIRTAIERVREFHQVQLDTLTEGWTQIGNGWGWRTYSHEREGGRETGKAAFAAFMQRMDASYREQLQDIVVLASQDGDRAAAEYVVHGQYLCDDEGLPPARGQAYVLPGGAFFDIRDDRIARVSNYYNLQDWIAQVSG